MTLEGSSVLHPQCEAERCGREECDDDDDADDVAQMTRDTWSDEAVKDVVGTNFVFWQACVPTLLTELS